MTKPCGSGRKVNGAVVRGRFAFLFGEACRALRRGEGGARCEGSPLGRRARVVPPASELVDAARRSETDVVTGQESAEAIVLAARGEEGPNIASREEP